MKIKHSPHGKALPFLVCAFVTFSCFSIIGVQPATGQVQAFPNTLESQITLHNLRQKAKPDECWAYLKQPAPLPMWTDPTNCGKYGTNPPAKPKVNQSYIWGIAESGDNLWFGTFANGNCVTQAGSSPTNSGNPNGAPNFHATDSWVCEFYGSPYFPGLYADARIGDARTPRAYQYNKVTRALVDRTPRASNWVDPARNPEGIYPLLIQMRGIRAAAVYNNVAILAGPSLSPSRGLGFFGWNATTGEFLGGYSVLGYNNIRQFLELNGILYTAVGTNDSTGKVTGGAVLRVAPSIIPDCVFNPANPIPCFVMNGGTSASPTPPTVVGTLHDVAGSITAHNGRIFTVTWPSQSIPDSMATLFMSPQVPEGGLTSANAAQWTGLWKATDYEPDPLIAKSYAGGAIASFDGYLWWGTLHIPMTPFQFLSASYPPASQEEAFANLMGTFRSTVFFRGKDLDTKPQVELLYGNYKLPVFTPPAAPGQPGSWALQVNKTGKRSLYGPSGFGNMWNTYTWSARVSNNKLWIGTMDWALMAQQGSALMASEGGDSLPNELFATANYGADLFYFVSASRPAFPESTNGVDNPTSYGVRNQINSNNGNLFLGMANPMNLLTDPADPKGFGGLGGWELNELQPSPNNTQPGQNVTLNLPNGVSITYCSVTQAGRTVSSSVTNPFTLGMRMNALLGPYDLNGPEIPPGIANPPTKVTLLWSTAEWGQGCSSSALATVSMPVPGAVTAPRLLQLEWDGAEYVWKDITSSVSADKRKVFGVLSKDHIGILGVAQTLQPIPDSIPPSVPTNLAAAVVSPTQVNLTWTASTDNVGVTGYQVFSNGTPLGTTAALSFSVTGLAPATSYSFTVTAFDAAANESAPSAAVSARTSGVPDTTPPSVPTDTEAPWVYLTTSQNGSMVTVSANAGDNAAVAGIQFKVDGANLGPEDTASPYSVQLDTKTLSNGTHKVTAMARDASGNQATSEAVSITVDNQPATSNYSIPSNGGQMFEAAGGQVDQLTVGSIIIERTGGTVAPAGVDVGFRKDGILVAEAGIPASTPMLAGRILAQIGGATNTGVAFTNPGNSNAWITFYFTNSEGVSSSPASFMLLAGHHFAAFLDQAPFNGAPMQGALTFTSTSPVAALGIRSFVNERAEFLFTVLPVLPLQGSGPSTDSAATIPLYTSGGGWTTEIVLTNPTDSALSGIMQFLAPDGSPVPTFVDGVLNTSFPYLVPMRGTVRLTVSNGWSTTETGSVRIIPTASNATPSATAIFSFNDQGFTVSQASVSAPPRSNAFRAYVEKAGSAGTVGSIRSGIAIANTSAEPVTVQLELNRLDGQRAGFSTIVLPAGGQMSRFLDELFSGFPAEFRGILRVVAVTTPATPAPITVTGLRGRYNERGNFLLTSTPATDEAAAPSDMPMVFTHVVNGQGYNTQLILFGDTSGAASGRLLHKNNLGVLQTESLKPQQ